MKEKKIIHIGEYEIIIICHDDQLKVTINDILGGEIETINISNSDENDDKINLN